MYLLSVGGSVNGRLYIHFCLFCTKLELIKNRSFQSDSQIVSQNLRGAEVLSNNHLNFYNHKRSHHITKLFVNSHLIFDLIFFKVIHNNLFTQKDYLLYLNNLLHFRLTYNEPNTISFTFKMSYFTLDRMTTWQNRVFLLSFSSAFVADACTRCLRGIVCLQFEGLKKGKCCAVNCVSFYYYYSVQHSWRDT